MNRVPREPSPSRERSGRARRAAILARYRGVRDADDRRDLQLLFAVTQFLARPTG